MSEPLERRNNHAVFERITRVEERIISSDKAVKVALESIDKRLEGMNEFRETLKDQASKFPTRNELWAAITTAMFLVIAIISVVQAFIK